MLDIVLRLGVADARLDVLLVAGDHCRHPVFVGEAEPAAQAAELDRLVADDVLVGKILQRAAVARLVAEHAERAFMQDVKAVGMLQADQKRTRLNSRNYYAYRMPSS